MTFTAKSSSEEDFSHWVQSLQQSGKSLNLDEYNQLVKPSEYNPVAYYVLGQADLFDQILMKYMVPPQQQNDTSQRK